MKPKNTSLLINVVQNVREMLRLVEPGGQALLDAADAQLVLVEGMLSEDLADAAEREARYHNVVQGHIQNIRDRKQSS